MLRKLWNDEVGAILSAELVFIMTILVIGMVVGLHQLQYAVVSELGDVASAIGHLNQSYGYTGFSAHKHTGGATKSATTGSAFGDGQDECDFANCGAGGAANADLGCNAPVNEGLCGNGVAPVGS